MDSNLLNAGGMSTVGIVNHSYLEERDSQFLAYLRGIAIIGIVLGHLGAWVIAPYGNFIGVLIPLFFFISGAVSYYSYQRSATTLIYLKKRMIGLLVPYYLACVFCILVYLHTQSFPSTISLDTIVSWLTIRPTEDLSGFPLGQVWFLHTLAVIVLVSPFYYCLYNKKPVLLYLILLVPLSLSTVQILYKIHPAFVVAGNNLFKPIVHSFFFIAGFIYFSNKRFHHKRYLIVSTAGGILLSIGLVFAFNLNIDYKYHTYSPDIYYIAGSFAAICGILLCQDILLRLCSKIRILDWVLDFSFRYTFAIFLLHSFAIWAAEYYLGLLHPQSNYVLYAIAKSTFVITLTGLMAIPFKFASDWLTAKCLQSPIRA